MKITKSNIYDLYIELTDKCDGNCIYCCNNSNLNKSTFIDKQTLFKVFDEIKKNNFGKMVRLSGGEVLLHPNIKEIINYLDLIKLPVMIQTNGLNLSNQFLQFCTNKDIYFQISLDSCNEEKNDYLRGRGTFKKIRENILNVSNLFEGRLSIAVTLSKLNCDEIEDLILYANNLNARLIIFNNLKKIGRASKLDNLILDSDLKSSNKLNSIFRNMEKKYSNLEIEYQGLDLGTCKLTNKKPIIEAKVDCNGNVYPCHGFSGDKFIIGNIYDESIEKILTGKKMNDLIVSLNELNNNKVCKNCFVNNWCKGGCLADLYNDKKTLEIYQNELCDIRKEYWLNKLVKN